MMGGWKQKSGWIQIPTASCVPFTFPFLSQPSVCLIVSRVRAYFTTDQHLFFEFRFAAFPGKTIRLSITGKSPATLILAGGQWT